MRATTTVGTSMIGALLLMTASADPSGPLSSGKGGGASPAADKAAQIAAGKPLYMGLCSTCHQPEGQGMPMVTPPLAGSDFLNADPKRAISIVLNGLSGRVIVNGSQFNSVMPPMSLLTDAEVANILTYVLNSWGNNGAQISAADVAAVRASPPQPPDAAR